MLAALRSFLRTLVRPGGSAREMSTELEWHVAERTDDLVRRGLSTDEPRGRRGESSVIP